MMTNEEKRARQRDATRRYREAHPEKAAEYREANRQKLRDKDRQYREANREKKRQQQRLYDETNREKRLESQSRYRKANPEIQRQYYKANQDKIKKRVRLWVQANPEKRRQTLRQNNQLRRACKLKALDQAAPQVTAIAIARRTWLFGNACAYCGSDGPLHLDHVEPLARGGLHTPGNLVPACQRCNLSKQAKPVEAWYISQPFFSANRWKALQAHTGRRWSAAEQLSLIELLPAQPPRCIA